MRFVNNRLCIRRQAHTLHENGVKIKKYLHCRLSENCIGYHYFWFCCIDPLCFYNNMDEYIGIIQYYYSSKIFWIRCCHFTVSEKVFNTKIMKWNWQNTINIARLILLTNLTQPDICGHNLIFLILQKSKNNFHQKSNNYLCR